MLNVFIGYDKNEAVAYHVLAHSILRRSSIPVTICPLHKPSFATFYNRPKGEYDSTDFSITRFLVPYLSNFDGFSVFMDCDMLVLGDVAELANYMTLMDFYSTAVRVVKHDYQPKEDTKFLGAIQTQYEKKNWSSVMLFNNSLCTRLTPEYVEKAPGLELHQFRWVDQNKIGSMPKKWNWLVGEPGYEIIPDDVKLLHYTKGTPCFDDYKMCEYASLWHAEYQDMISHG